MHINVLVIAPVLGPGFNPGWWFDGGAASTASLVDDGILGHVIGQELGKFTIEFGVRALGTVEFAGTEIGFLATSIIGHGHDVDRPTLRVAGLTGSASNEVAKEHLVLSAGL